MWGCVCRGGFARDIGLTLGGVGVGLCMFA